MQAFECEGCSTKCQESCTDKECTQCVKVRHDHAKKTYRTEKQPNKLICRINRYFVSKEKSKSAARVTLPFDGFSWTREQDGKQTRSDYELVMVNKHKGSEPTEGHYVSYVKKKGEWIRCDDANVKGFSTKKVAEDAIQSRRDGDAYLLFFRRVQQLEDVKRDEEHGDGGKHGHSGATDDDKGNRGRARP